VRGIPDTLTEAQSLFLRRLLDGEIQRGEGVEGLCAQRPELAEELRSCHAKFQRIRQLQAVGTGCAPEALDEQPCSLPLGTSGTVETSPIEIEAEDPNRPIHLGNYSFGGRVIDGDPPCIAVVRDENLGREVVMKVHRPRQGEAADDSLRAFLREAAVLGVLDHSGVPSIHELGVDREGRAFFTTPLRQGRELRAEVESIGEDDGRWSEARAVRVLIEVCEILGAAHRRGIVHGALSTRDVFVGEYGEVQIMEWRSALVTHEPDVERLQLQVHRSLSLTELFGSAAGSPEREPSRRVESSPRRRSRPLSGGDPDLAIDLRSVGEVIDEVHHAAQPRGSGGSPELLAIAQRARRESPSESYRGTGQLADDLRAFLDRRVVRAYRTGAVAELRQWCVRNRGIVAIVSSALLAVATNLAFLGISERRRGDEILELSESQAVGIFERATEELWASRLEQDEEAWWAKARELHEAGRDLIGRIELLRQRHDPPQSARTAADQNRIVDARLLADSQARHLLLSKERSYRWWRHEIIRLTDLRERGSASEVDLARLQLLDRTLEPGLGREIEALSLRTPDPEERFDPDGDREDWRMLRLERLFRSEEELTRDSPGFDPAHYTGPARGALADIARALAHREEWEGRLNEAVRASWREAIGSVSAGAAAAEHSPAYPLLPLRRDPLNGLWEFWDLRTGREPVIGVDGEPLLDEDTAMIYVLLPWSADQESASTPFFISKYEMTQAQWQRFSLKRSYYWAGSNEGDDHGVTRRHPAEQKPRADIEWMLRRLGLRLPTEAQWEHAAGCGRSSGYWWGDSPSEAAAGLENFEAVADRHEVHAPVGTFAPNPLGLHDVQGNVAEVCRAGEGSESEWVVRGGDWDRPAEECRLDSRGEFLGESTLVGIRPVMELVP